MYREDRDEVGVAINKFLVLAVLLLGLPSCSLVALAPVLFGHAISSTPWLVFMFVGSALFGLWCARDMHVCKTTYRGIRIDDQQGIVEYFIHPKHAIGNDNDGLLCTLDECRVVVSPVKVVSDAGPAVLKGMCIIVCMPSLEFAVAIQRERKSIDDVVAELKGLGMRVEESDALKVIHGYVRRRRK